MKRGNDVTAHKPKMRRRTKAHDTKNRRPLLREEPEPFVTVVALDNNVPGGFRLQPVPCPQPERS